MTGFPRRTLLAGVVALTASACGSGGDGDDSANADDRQATVDDAAKNANVSQAVIRISPDDNAENVGINNDVKVTVENGTIDEISMTAPDTGAEVSGTLSDDGTTWQPDIQLERATQYELSVKASDNKDRRASESVTFTTVSEENSFIGYFTPEDGSTVGVGMLVSLNFDKSISNQAEVEQAVTITTSSGQEVRGHWFSDTRLDFRPDDYWEANSTVTVHLAWDGLEGSSGVYGVQDRTFSFTVSRSQVSTVNVNTLQMKVVRDGKTVKTIPVTTGSADNPTWNGQMVITEQFKETRMDGATVGFTDNDGEGEYDIPDVPHAQRLTTSGTFIHGNYWASGAFGNYNASHGCIGLSDAQGANDSGTDGYWFYDNSLLGDVVIVEHADEETVSPDNGLNGWNMTWSDWLSGSALS